MSLLTAMGANALCTMGTAPAPLKVTSQSKVLLEGKPAATIQDSAPTSNVGPFGMCTSMANPAVHRLPIPQLLRRQQRQWVFLHRSPVYRYRQAHGSLPRQRCLLKESPVLHRIVSWPAHMPGRYPSRFQDRPKRMRAKSSLHY